MFHAQKTRAVRDTGDVFLHTAEGVNYTSEVKSVTGSDEHTKAEKGLLIAEGLDGLIFCRIIHGLECV